jgi:hypothetical protein
MNAPTDFLPETELPLVIRTDFSDPEAWDAIREEIRPEDAGAEQSAPVEFADDRAYEGFTVARCVELVEDPEQSFLVVADKEAMSGADHPVLVVDLHQEVGREFRSAAAELYQIAHNLWIGNMDFAEFADAVDDDGIFRGF